MLSKYLKIWTENNVLYVLQIIDIDDYNLLKYDLCTTTFFSNLFTSEQPDIAIVSSNSSLKIFKIFATPSVPLAANPYRTGRPTNTILAPKANALNTSVPVLTPPSIIIDNLPETAFDISEITWIVAGTPSNNLAPWFETIIPWQPAFTARTASSFLNIPFTIIGSLVIL